MTFYATGMEHSLTSATGTGSRWEASPPFSHGTRWLDARSETDHVTDCLVEIAAVAGGAIAHAALPRIRAPTA
jgi:hypothetical protein